MSWRCAHCGAENERKCCWLCKLAPSNEETEAEEAARIIAEAEREFSELLDWPISFVNYGGTMPTTIEEARVLVAENREHLADQLEGRTPRRRVSGG